MASNDPFNLFNTWTHTAGYPPTNTLPTRMVTDGEYRVVPYSKEEIAWLYPPATDDV